MTILPAEVVSHLSTLSNTGSSDQSPAAARLVDPILFDESPSGPDSALSPRWQKRPLDASDVDSERECSAKRQKVDNELLWDTGNLGSYW